MITEEKESSCLAGEGVRSGGVLIMEVRSRCQVRACGGRQRCHVLLSDCASHLNTSRSQILCGLGCLKRAVHTAAQTCKTPRGTQGTTPHEESQDEARRQRWQPNPHPLPPRSRFLVTPRYQRCGWISSLLKATRFPSSWEWKGITGTSSPRSSRPAE